MNYDLAVVGRGIIGLAHALAGLRQGLRVAVVDREARATGASIRNFGFVTVTGQQEGISWRRARRAREVWAELGGPAGIAIHQRGLLMCARRPEAVAVLEDFAASAMGEGCRLLRHEALPAGLHGGVLAALHSPHELRVESRQAVPALAAYLEAQGVAFLRRAAVTGVETGRLHTSRGSVEATHIVVCPGPDLVSLFPEEAASRSVTLCKLHMMRVAAPPIAVASPVMSDLGMVRYAGYAVSPRLPALRERLLAEQAAWLEDGIHLIAAAGADGSLIVGDSHQYGESPDPFQPEAVDARILAELSLVLDLPEPRVLERWVGVYPSGRVPAFVAAPLPGVRLAQVTSGTGASTGFALAEETMADLLGLAPPPHEEVF